MSGPRSKRTSDFNILKELQDSDATGKKSHPVTIRNKIPEDPANLAPRETKDWYFKVMFDPAEDVKKLGDPDNKDVADREVIAQEFFRLFIPNYPKTRIVEDGTLIYVASAGIPNFQAVEKMDTNDIRQGILDGRYKGLGHTSVMALFCNEIDFKPGNLVLSNGNFIKIDGDWCFASLRENRKADDPAYNITADTIAGLPYCTKYEAYNWLDEISQDTATKSNMLDPQMVNNVHFRREVNEQLLKIMLMPKDLFINFMMNYTNNMMILSDLEPILIGRQQQMSAAAMANKDFRAYLQTDEAKKLAAEFSNQAINFSTTGKQKFVTDSDKAQVVANMQGRFKMFSERVAAEDHAIRAAPMVSRQAPDLTGLPPVPVEALPLPPSNKTAVIAKGLPPKPSGAPAPPPTATVDASGPSSIALSVAEFQNAFENALLIRTKSMTTFQPKKLTNEAAILRKQMDKAPDDVARGKLAEDFIKKHPDDLLTKPLKEVMLKVSNAIGFKKF